MNRRPLILGLAAVLAAGAGLLAFDYVAASKHKAEPPRTVLIASQPLHKNDPIVPAAVHLETRAAEAIDPGAFSQYSDVNGDVALADIPAGAALTNSNTGKVQALGTPVRLHKGMRAMSIAVDEVKDVSGIIQPGDHVDVIAVPPRMNDQPHAYAIIRNVVVLAVGGVIEPVPVSSPGQGSQIRSVTLEVTPKQADLLALADLNAVLRLTLRTPDETTRSEPTEHLVFATQQERAPVAAAPVPAAAPVIPAPVQPQPQRPAQTQPDSPVTFILGDRVEGHTP
jgi:pilus assembly protein CpaB